MPSKGSSGGDGKIQPCYDGRVLPGMHHVAGEGLSAIAVKQCHRHCKFTTDPQSRRPLITCNQGINARNSFWNLHKPDLRKIKGLECSTSGSVAQLFRAHNAENAEKPTYKKRMLRLLESLVVKKSKKSVAAAEVLLQNSHWAAQQCVLAPLVHETEMKSPKIVSLHDDFSTNQPGGGNDLYNHNIDNTVDSDTVDTLFISQPQGANMQTNSSDNAFVGIGFNQVMGLSSVGISSDLFTPLKETSGMGTARALPTSDVPSCLKLKKKHPLPQLSTVRQPKSQYCEFFQEHIEDLDSSGNMTDKHNQAATNEHVGSDKIDRTEDVRNTAGFNKGGSLPLASSSEPSSLVINTIVNEMLEEMQEIEDYINSYTSSFCVREEEFTNYQAFAKKSSEVVDHFFKEVRSAAKLRTDDTERKYTDIKSGGERNVPCQIPEFLTNNGKEDECFTKIEEVEISTQVHNLNDDNHDVVLSPTRDSGIDLDIEFGVEEKGAILYSVTDKKNSLAMLRNKNFPCINLIEFDEVNIEMCKNDSSTEITSTFHDLASGHLIEFDDIFYDEFHTQENTQLSLQHNSLDDITVIDGVFHNEISLKEHRKKSNNNILQSGVLQFDDTLNINNATNGYCFWEESDVVMDTGLCTEISTNYTNTTLAPENIIFSDTCNALVPCTFIADVWREYSEGVYQEALLKHDDVSEPRYNGPFPSYGYWANLYQEVYEEAEDIVHTIDNFVVNGCGTLGPRASSYHYNESCSIVEIEDEVFSRTKHLSELNLFANEESHINSRCTDIMNDTAMDNARKIVQKDEAFKLRENESAYSEKKDDRYLRSHNCYLLDNSCDIDIETREKNTTQTREINTQKYKNPDESKYKDSLDEKSRLVQVPGNTNNLDNENPQMIFTSPNVHLNLTNPVVNLNLKK